MIGSKILYRHYPQYGPDQYKAQEQEGIVVDAFTDIHGSMKGDVFLGFGDAHGNIKSTRTYKVQYYQKYISYPSYENIRESQLIKIIEFKSSLNQEVEKYEHTKI